MSKLDFSKCLFDPTRLTKAKKVQDVFPELLPYKDISDIVFDWQVGICLTDLGSPFIKIKDHKQKLDAIYDYFGFDRIKGKLSDEYDLAVKYRPCGIMDVCTFMIEYQNNYDFAAWFTLNQSYFELMQVIRTPKKEDDDEGRYWDRRSKNQERSAAIAEKLKDYEVNLFGSAAMKTAAARSKKIKIQNYNEKYSQENQVE